MRFTVFYSWQSDHSGKTNRRFIERALTDAIQAIRTDATVEAAPRPEPHLDRDTRGVPGTPDIARTIFDKIDRCGIYVADLTFVGRGADRASGEAARLLPNPNVLLELGYAIKSLGWERIVLVMNSAYGQPDALPFDLRQRRFPIQYNLAEEGGDAPSARRALAGTLERALRDVIDSGLLSSVLADERPAEGQPLTWHDPRIAGVARYVSVEREAFEEKLRKRQFHGMTAEGGIIAISVIPARPITPRLDIGAVAEERPLQLATIGSSGLSARGRGRSVIAMDRFRREDEPHAVTELTDTGIVRATEGDMLSASKHLRLSGQPHLPTGVVGFIPSIKYEQDVIDAVTRYSALLNNYKVPLPYHIAVSLLAVRGYIMGVAVSRMDRDSVIYDHDDIRPDPVILREEADPGSVAKLLRPAFDFIWREFGFQRSLNFDDTGTWSPR